MLSGVVEHLDVVEDVGLCFLTSHLNPALDALAFEELKEALGDRVVVAVAAPAHAAGQVMCFQEILPVVPSELRALIRVHQQPRRRLTSPYGHHQGLQHHVGVHR